MIPAHVEHSTRTLGKPKDWDESKGPCMGLPIRDLATPHGNCMVSAWTPSPAEVAAINRGEPVLLFVFGLCHPVVSIGVRGEV